MVDGKILGIDQNLFFGGLALLLLVILGVVSFHAYMYASTSNGLSIGAGAGVSVLQGYNMYSKNNDAQE